jgi:transposase
VTEWTVAIGVDTHKDAHVAVALDRLGGEIDSLTVQATHAGYEHLVAWATELGRPAFGVEGCGSYGAGLVRFLEAESVPVYECERPLRRERRRGKNDHIDAGLAARRVVSGQGLSIPRGGGQREVLRLLLVERRGAVRARTAAMNQLSSLVVTAPDPIRGQMAGLSKQQLARKAAQLRSSSGPVANVLRRIARRVDRRLLRDGAGDPIARA